MSMSNYNEYRLHQIQILINAYMKSGDDYPDEIRKLEQERDSILQAINEV